MRVHRPHVELFDVPKLRTRNIEKGEPISALLDGEPTPEWQAAFEQAVSGLSGDLAEAQVRLAGNRILFFGSTTSARRLADEVRALVIRVSTDMPTLVDTAEHLESSAVPTSFERNGA